MYRTLDADRIVATIDQLGRRIEERFPGAGLAQVCAELAAIARDNRMRAERLARPHAALRLAIPLVLVGGGAGLTWLAMQILRLKANASDLFGVMQGIEASVNLLIVVGAAVLFLVTLEKRWKRREALEGLHELRSVAHVIDMHQLTKDPMANPEITPPTPSSPARTLTPAELVRYLDYCSEMLSLTAKVAALYAQSSGDEVVIAATGDIGQISANSSQKIWQKISIVQAIEVARLRQPHV